MQTTRRKVRRDYSPLSISLSMVVQTPLSPLTQVYNSTNEEEVDGVTQIVPQYEPDRELSPTILFPKIVAYATDGSWKNGLANNKISNIVWYVIDGDKKTPITELSDWTGKYIIQDDDSYEAGTLTIKKNIEQSAPVVLVFECVMADTRLGINHKIVSDHITLSTVDKSGDDYSLSIGASNIFEYCALDDPLLNYEYECSIDGVKADEEKKKEYADDQQSYLLRIPVHLYKGREEIAIGNNYSLSLHYANKYDYDTDSDSTLVSEFSSYDAKNQVIEIDCRFIEDETFLILIHEVLDASTSQSIIVAQQTFQVHRVIPNVELQTINETTIREQDEERSDALIARYRGRLVKHPEIALKLTWKSDSDGATGVTYNEGTSTTFKLNKAKVGEGDSAFLETYIDYEHKGVKHVMTDENGEAYTDENGDVFIGN